MLYVLGSAFNDKEVYQTYSLKKHYAQTAGSFSCIGTITEELLTCLISNINKYS